MEHTGQGLESLTLIDKTLVTKASISVGLAFQDDSLKRCVIKNPSKRANFRYVAEMYLRQSIVDKRLKFYTTSPECEGVIAWIPSGVKPSTITSIRSGYPFMPLRCGWRYFWLDIKNTVLCNKMRRKFAPPRHVYLILLAVSPLHQGQGFASKLLKPFLEKLDQDDMPCYLETQNTKNVAMYQHFGFKLLDQITVIGTDHPLYLLLRQK